MTNSYKVKVNDLTEFEITEAQVSNLNAIKVSDSKSHILQNNSPFQAEITEANFHSKTYTVAVNNNTYYVVISDALDVLIKAMGFAVGASKLINAIKAPMPGLILDISVSVGDTIEENQPLLILEAMKMENSILSPRDGIIKAITVAKGEAVDKGQLLIEFE
ncbi:acetyl-CoA carboxylase biotin carboxyl carrier protein subunit [Lacinutrix sp. Hel_I_90]|uniref:acetyl-CoA carboxylase biotin carboxyl carrier protein subunit n=1 Tax=Lacinutrix sp. Hel_I_90 TaxID=1249999 RepID=UPI0005C85865|nr:acetyl-CoA carboxylase biotin carboxyl carrier protein subunit [Lacinutrix sp. Hel_I_90]